MVLHFVMPSAEASMELRKETEASAAAAPRWESKDTHTDGLEPQDAVLKREWFKTRRCVKKHMRNYTRATYSVILKINYINEKNL